jgi:hypothetical protein
MNPLLAPALLAFAAGLALPALTPPVPGDDPPPGLPWIRTYDEARSDALRHRRPVFVYFTKTH